MLPIAQPPMADGIVHVADGRVVAVSSASTVDSPGARPDDVVDLGAVALLPGFVNAHTHLELSWMAGLVPPQGAMDEWIRTLMTVRRDGPAGGQDEIDRAVAAAMAAMAASGTVLVGDISNTLSTPHLIAAAGLGGVVFKELIGFTVTDPEPIVRNAWRDTDEAAKALERTAATDSLPLRFSVVAHAPYSVSPQLISEIARQQRAAPLAIHLGESAAEMQFLREGTGPIRQMLERLDVWHAAFETPACGPVEYMSRLGYLTPGSLVVHGVHFDAAALRALKAAAAVVVTCPRSNAWVGSGAPPLQAFFDAGVPVAIGTDSLASVGSLHVIDDLAECRRLAPGVPAARLLESATRVGAEALGFGAECGTIEPGKRAAFAAVRVPPGVVDVEEYLVGGNVDAAADIRLVRPV